MTPRARKVLAAALVGIAGLAVLAGCASGQPAPYTGSRMPPEPRTGPTGVLRIAWPAEPEVLCAKLGAGGGVNEVYWVFNSFLTHLDFSGNPHPMIAREIPTPEKGDWVINPDGTMVTTYRLRENARWHDGTPLTAADFVFAHQVYLDPEVPVRDRVPETLISGVEAAGDHTLVISWKEPYIYANRLGYQQLDPLARHVFQEKYRSNKPNFLFGEEWTSGYIGAGPFRVERWNPGSGVIARANLEWVLGPPKLAVVDIRFIQDATTQLANLLAGEVDLISSPGIRAPEAVVARDHLASRGEGYIRTWHSQIRFLAFQFREVPNWQRAIADVRVRRALMHASDRQGLVEALNHGLGAPADVFLASSDPAFSEVDRAITKYPRDVHRALELLAEAGWRPPPAGGLVRGAAGQTLDVELWTTAGGGGEQEAAILADSWRAVGINSSIYMIPSARQRDHELRASFPAVNATARTLAPDNFVFTSRHLPTAEVRWQGANRGSFQDPEVDRFQNIIFTSFKPEERLQATIELHKRMSELVGIGPLYYGAEVLAARNRVKGPIGENGLQSGMSWNIFQWEVVD